MKREIIHEALALDIPDEFQRMTAEETLAIYRDENPNRWGTWNRRDHVMLIAAWSEYSALTVWLSDLRTMAKRNQSLVRKGYEGHDYQLLEYFSARAGKVPMEGYRFTYSVQSVRQYVSTVLLKKGRTVYSLSCIGWDENRQENKALFRDILDSLQLL